MDNIFEILIYAFIIISFLSSLFKKRKAETKKNDQAEAANPEPKPQLRTSQQEDYDLLKEIEKMFKMETPSSEKKEERSFETEEKFEPASEHLETTDWHQPIPSEHKRTTSEHTVERWADKTRKVEDKRKAVNEKIVKQAQIFEKRLAERRVTDTQFKKNIMQKFKEPNSLKEYIIFSEILGKPKALQE